MSILIKGLDIPKESMLMTVHNGSAYVIPVGEDEGKTYEVIEVKTPHGRLIDAGDWYDAAYEHFDDLHMGAAKNMIIDMPTVLEAEEGMENNG